jgi:hypothetical protein
MDQISQLIDRIRSLEAQVQRMQEQYPVSLEHVQQGQGRYGDFRTATDAIPALPEIVEQEAREGEQAQTERRAAVSEMELPDFDPYAWGDMQEDQSEAVRRQEIVRIQKRRQARKQAQDDQFVLNQATMDIDSQPPEAQFEAAQAFANEFKARVAAERGLPPNVRPAQSWGPETPPEPVAPQRQPEPDKPRQPREPNYPLPPPYTPVPDTSTQIPQPPDWRDTPERRAGGPVNQSPQQQTFGQAQASFDNAVARQLEMLAGFVQDATRRVEELEVWREAFCQE